MTSPYQPERLAEHPPRSLHLDAPDGLRLHLLHWPARRPRELPPALLLHGFTNDAHLWDPLGAELSAERDVYALDFRGHGDSGREADGRYLHASLADDLVAAVEHFAPAGAVLVGHSLGARVAMLASPRLGRGLKALVVLDTGPEVRAAGVRKVRRDAEGTPERFESAEHYYQWLRRIYLLAEEWALRHIARHGLAPCPDGGLAPKTDPAFTRALWDPASHQGDSSDLRAPLGDQLWQALAAINAPTLLLRGELSAILSRETARRMVKDALPCARLITIPRAGHALMCDNPAACIEAIAGFLSELHAAA